MLFYFAPHWDINEMVIKSKWIINRRTLNKLFIYIHVFDIIKIKYQITHLDCVFKKMAILSRTTTTTTKKRRKNTYVKFRSTCAMSHSIARKWNYSLPHYNDKIFSFFVLFDSRVVCLCNLAEIAKYSSRM